MSDGQIAWAIIGTLIVIFGAYYATYVVAKRSNKTQQGRAVQVLDRFSLSKDKLFCLISMGDKIYLIGMSDGAVSLIDTIEGEAAEALRAQTRVSLENNLVARGLAFVKNRRARKGFDQALDDAKLKWEKSRDGDGDPSHPELQFAREEDDIDAMLRQIAARKGKDRKNDNGGEPL